MIYYNQNDYANTPYPSPGLPKATIKSGGCGVVSASMIVTNMTGQPVSIPMMAQYAINKGARVNGGTDIIALAKALTLDYGLRFQATNDECALLNHLKGGGMAIVNVGGDRTGYIGVFSNEGHFVVAAGLTDTGKVIILDPGYYAGKFNKAGRAGKVTVQGNNCICDISVLASDTNNRTPSYCLFARKEVEKMTDKTPCKINIKGIEFPGYLQGGSSFFAEGVKVKDVIAALSNNITWEEKTLTATIK